ncbi:TPA: hypothetical protein N0F65_012207 [Lagenidium giganteum]|uniref:Uncharacterized protein n=1 Tax=Lagenidium giganteum TaxID=4803 RepID=A0AAV2ZIL5_9STRA|nr:TPA: hypothetical protein N0F65_012207 [Lagenidium giganteum]
MSAHPEREPILPQSVSLRPKRYEVMGARRLKQLPLLFALVGVVVAPLLLVVDFQNSRNTDSLVATHAATEDAVFDQFLPATTTFTLDQSNLKQYCQEKYFHQRLDHFRAFNGTYKQRYFICDQHARKDGAIFFYVGNEADVELYLNNTGLMWENAAEFGATLVFAEHRYFGKSIPFGKDVLDHMQYLSSEQALADYAVLIRHIKRERKLNPHILDGAIAASAPILAFLGDEKEVDMESFARVTTFDASPAAGSAVNCIPNVRRVWKVMAELGKTDAGRKQLADAFLLCKDQVLQDESDVKGLINWAKGAYDYMAMGNYPYPSPYIMNGQSVLPAYPVQVACSHLAPDFAADDDVGLLHAFRDSVGVYYNSTQLEQCYSMSAPSNASQEDADFWQYLFCSELYMPTSINGVDDMFWSVPWNQTSDDADCVNQWGIHLKPDWAVTQFGGRKALATASNIVFSNGNYDPWSGTGVLNSVSDSVVYVSVEGGAHHLDLFFSNPLDPQSVKNARGLEKAHMWKWVRQYRERQYANAATTM